MGNPSSLTTAVRKPLARWLHLHHLVQRLCLTLCSHDRSDPSSAAVKPFSLVCRPETTTSPVLSHHSATSPLECLQHPYPTFSPWFCRDCRCHYHTVVLNTVKPRYNAPDFNIIPPIKYKCFGPKKYFHSYLYVGNSENLGLKHNFGQSLEMRYSGV